MENQINYPIITPLIVLGSENGIYQSNLSNQNQIQYQDTYINQKQEYFPKYSVDELVILNNYCNMNGLFLNYYYSKIDKSKKICIFSHLGNKTVKIKNKKNIGNYCTIIYVGENNFYYGFNSNRNDSKLIAAKNALKYNIKLNKYAERYLLN